MKEILTIVEAYRNINFSTTKAALAILIRIEGSSYRRTGARMLILDNGVYTGGISGGCLEGDALRKAQKAIAQNKPAIITYDTTDEDGHEIGIGLGCNGIIDVLLIPLDHLDASNPVNVLARVTGIRSPVTLVTIAESLSNELPTGKVFVFHNEVDFLRAFAVNDIAGDIINDIKYCLATNVSSFKEYISEAGKIKLFIEFLPPVINLIIYGGNYDIFPMARISKELGWKVKVVMNRLKASKSLFSLVDKVTDAKGNEVPEIDHYTAILLMSHDYESDLSNLKKLINTPFLYLGILGPVKRYRKMLDTFALEGIEINEDRKDLIFSPAGLDIGARTPEEIALSVTAEIISSVEGKKGTSLRLKEGSIHERN